MVDVDCENQKRTHWQNANRNVLHFFKSFADGAKVNLNIKAEGHNEHHKIEAIFKAFAKAIRAAIKRDAEKLVLPSTKGKL